VSTAGNGLPLPPSLPQGCRALEAAGLLPGRGEGRSLSSAASAFKKCLLRNRATDICQKKLLIFAKLPAMWEAEPGKLAACQHTRRSPW